MRAKRNSLSSVFEAVLSETVFGLCPIKEADFGEGLEKSPCEER